MSLDTFIIEDLILRVRQGQGNCGKVRGSRLYKKPSFARFQLTWIYLCAMVLWIGAISREFVDLALQELEFPDHSNFELKCQIMCFFRIFLDGNPLRVRNRENRLPRPGGAAKNIRLILST